MSNSRMTWSDRDSAKLFGVVSRATSVTSAVEAAKAAFPKTDITYDVISNRLKRMGEPSLAVLTSKNHATVDAAVADYKARERLAALEAKNKKLVAELAATQDELISYKSLARAPLTIPAPKVRTTDTQRKGVPLMLCSDWHVEEPVDPRTVNGINEYNLEIADKCITKLAEAYTAMIQDSPRFDCRTGLIWLGGDLMTGYIHDELVEGNLLSPQQTQVWLLDRIETMLRTIAATSNLDKIMVACNSGNHGRATHKQRINTRENNSNEQVIYQTLRRVLRDDPRFEFHIADGQWLEVDVMGYRMAFTHGDTFKYGGGVGGISIPIKRGIAREFQGRKMHQYCMGHFHQRQDFGDVQINGSMIGYSAYAQSIHAAPEQRQQAWMMIDSKRGKALSAPIWLPQKGE